MSVRPSLIGDLSAVLALERAVPGAPHWPEADYRKILEANHPEAVKRCLFVWEADAEILGFSVGMLLDAGEWCEGQLENVLVAESARCKGIGGALCAAILAWGRQGGAESIGLEVRASNLSAIRLYQRLGFRTEGRRSAYYRNPPEDAILMKRGYADSFQAVRSLHPRTL